MKKVALILISTLVLFSACKTENSAELQQNEAVTLVFYGLFDDESVFEPLIESFKSEHPNITILYRQFTDQEDYSSLILNELAEGEGPDIFLISNVDLERDSKKIVPVPENLMPLDVFESTYVPVVAEDLIFADEGGKNRLWSLPLYVDSLALYYNASHFAEVFPERPFPSDTWNELIDDVTELTLTDNSFERFARSGIAMGRSDNISKTFDTFLLLLLQSGQDFYDMAGAVDAINLLTSFSLPSQKQYSWNRYLSDSDSDEKELISFASGKVSMILGYSYTYDLLIQEIFDLNQWELNAIDVDDVKIQGIPQWTEETLKSPISYAKYLVPVVSRNSENPDLAWEFLKHLSQPENLSYYFEKTHKPSPILSLSQDQIADPIYGVFANQVFYAKSIQMADSKRYESIILAGIEKILGTADPQSVLSEMQSSIQNQEGQEE